MTTDTNYASDEELFRRLQQNLHEAMDEATRPARRARLAQETTDLVRALAGRAYDQPDRWGLDRVPPESRDDVACDVLVSLLAQATSGSIRSSIAEWVARQIGRRLQEVTAGMSETASAPGERTSPGAEQGAVGDSPAGSVLDAMDGPWQRFEREFPREALALRLRYLLKRTPEEMVEILGIPSVGAVGAQVSRARAHMRAFLESVGYDARAVAGVLSLVGGDQE